ncbi:MAG: 50S ribosomal protein L23 [Bacilli bacterium]|nr:50S ribosomal protein L23 [Bacilli bacterium]
MSPLFSKKTTKKENDTPKVISEKTTSNNLNFDTYLQPYITEKTNDLSAQNKYVFIVLKRTNKVIIKQLVERNYKVKVDKVNVVFLTVSPKRLGFRKQLTRKGGYKKAIVTLKEGYKIDLAI